MAKAKMYGMPTKYIPNNRADTRFRKKHSNTERKVHGKKKEQVRVVKLQEKKQRGCQYCMDMKRVRLGKYYCTGCPYPECKYHELDNYETYEEYMESEDCRILVTEFFETVAQCYDGTHFKNAPMKLS